MECIWKPNPTLLHRFSACPYGLHKELSAPDLGVLQNKVDALLAAWDKKYDAHLVSRSNAKGKDLAAELALEAERKRSELRSLLKATLKVDDAVDWESLKSKAKYQKQPFTEPRPPQPRNIPLPEEPKIGFFDKIFGGAKKKTVQYQALVETVKKGRGEEQAKFESLCAERRQRQDKWDAEQKEKEADFLAEQSRANALIDGMKARWQDGDPDTIIEHATLVLDRSNLPDCIPKNFDIAYQAETKTLVLHYQLPDPDDLPLTKTVKYVATTGELPESKITQKEAKDLFDDTCYQLSLRTIHELFEADTLNHIDAIVFNGFTYTVDRSTGK